MNGKTRRCRVRLGRYSGPLTYAAAGIALLFSEPPAQPAEHPSAFAAPPAKWAEGAPVQPTKPAADASEVLARIQKAYTSSASVNLTFVQTYTPAGFTTTAPETGTLILQAPDEVRFDYHGPEGKVFTFDGKAARQYVAADKQLVVRTLTPEERERLPVLFLQSPASLLTRFEASVGPGLNGLQELTLTPRWGNDPRSLALAVSATGEVKRLVILDGGDNRTVFTFTQKAAGPRHPPADFALVPPEGTRVLSE